MNTEIEIPNLNDEDIGTLFNARTYPQFCEMVRRIQSKDCPFCNLNTALNKVIMENTYWRAWLNPFPQKHHQYHFIIAHKEHVTHVNDLRSQGWVQLGASVLWLSNHFGLSGGGIIVRFGDPRLNTGGVRHLHANIQVPDGSGEVRVPLAKKPEDVEEKKKVIRVFEKMRLGTAFENLAANERELVKDRLT